MPADHLPDAGPGAAPQSIAFAPVPVRPRRDGWTADKQRLFIAKLAETGLVTVAARAVGMTDRSAHKLALREDAESFCHAWDMAMLLAVRRAVSKLFEYGLDGMTETVWRDGVVTYRRRRPSEKALFFLLSHYHLARFGPTPAIELPRNIVGEPIDEVQEAAANFDLFLAGLHDLPPGDECDDADDAEGVDDEAEGVDEVTATTAPDDAGAGPGTPRP